MSVLSSAAVLAAIASVSLGGCSKGGVSRAPHSPAEVYRLCSDIRFRCVLAPDVQEPAHIEPAALGTGSMSAPEMVQPIQIDTNLTAPARGANLG